jgi:hypothetical protein
MLGVAGALAVAVLILGVVYRWEAAIPAAGLVLFAVVLGATGLWRLTAEPEAMNDRDATRLMVLVVGGWLGFTISVVALALAIRWREVFTGGMESWQGANAWKLWLCIFLELVGLAAMFASLQLARTQERSNPVLRRLLYGFNAVLTGLLLLAFLVVLNVLAYLYLPVVSDWTASSLFTLSPKSKNILEGLGKPVKVYVLTGSREDPVFGDVQNLMDNCQAVTNKFEVEYLSRDRSPERLGELMRRYQLVNTEGLLVVYGSPPQENHEFIKKDDLAEIGGRGFSAEDKPRWVFKGEDALMTAINYLEEGKSKPVVYFTQGNGELDINDSQANQPIDEGAGLLRERLQKSNYEVKGLRLSPIGTGRTEGKNVVTAKEVPDDAALIVVAGPRQKFLPEAVTALRDYMSKPAGPKKAKGKLVVLLDVVTAQGKMVQTGLEELLAEYNVRMGNDQVLAPLSNNPLYVRVTANPRLRDRNPVAAAFSGQAFRLYNVRTVRPISGSAPGRAGLQADPLLLCVEIAQWAEESFPADPERFIAELRENHPKELEAKLMDEPLPVAVAVSEGGQSPEMFNPHAPKPATEQTPRLLVIGDATFASNRAMGGEGNTLGYALFASCLSWLRERPDNIGIEPKKRAFYQLNEDTNVSRMILLPTGLMAFGVVGLGLGVWVIRRR